MRGKPPFKQRDLERALRAANRAGPKGARVEIRPDGVIAIIDSTNNPSAPASVNLFDAEADRLRKQAAAS